MSHTIELKKVSKYYAGEDTISMGISRVDLDLDIGEFVAITGESGSGKSTLLNFISGLDTYEEGELFVCGEDTTAYGTEDYEKYRKTYIGNIFQEFNLINSYTVYQNIEAVMLLSGKNRKECRAQINELIEQVGLSSYRNTKV
ncbi:MAG: ATP-binding cassette domain-containing protein, partial [Ruminococcus sp.]|nr:ATP-binding cassette domain-containing protein [Ruminococcus sp.]